MWCERLTTQFRAQCKVPGDQPVVSLHMAQTIITEHGAVGASHQVPAVILPKLVSGTLIKLACKCSPDDDADFLIKKDRIVCTTCGHEVLCAPPVLGVFSATCACCISSSIKSTFILDSRGMYVCTWCGVTR